MRHIIDFRVSGATLFATIDAGASATGLLIVSGGNEIRVGAHRGMARLAQVVAAGGFPVFRFDRRGVGDSEGENGGYAGSADDIDAALAAFRNARPELKRIVAFGNCDAATALIAHGTKVDALVLANPWVIEQADALPPPAAIRTRYRQRLRDPKAWRALATGQVNIGKAIRGLWRISTPKSQPEGLATTVAARMASSSIPTTIIVANGDNTGIAFAAEWRSAVFEPARRRNDVSVLTIPSSSHSFATEADFERLVDVLTTVLRQ